MEGRMTVCNMSIEAGARTGMVAPDETTFAYVKRQGEYAPQGEEFEKPPWSDGRALAHRPGCAVYDTRGEDRRS